jgi:hypothetical protein
VFQADQLVSVKLALKLARMHEQTLDLTFNILRVNLLDQRLKLMVVKLTYSPVKWSLLLR